MGHIVSHEGVKVDPSKIKAIKEWKIPTSIKTSVRISQVDTLLSQVC